MCSSSPFPGPTLSVESLPHPPVPPCKQEPAYSPPLLFSTHPRDSGTKTFASPSSGSVKGMRMNLGPSELGSRSEGTGSTGEKLRLVAELEVRRGVWCQSGAECTLTARDGWSSPWSFHGLPALASWPAYTPAAWMSLCPWVETGPSGSMTSMVGKSVFLQGLHQILFHQPHDIDFPANDVSQSVPAQSPRLLVRAHKTKSEIHVQFPPTPCPEVWGGLPSLSQDPRAVPACDSEGHICIWVKWG